jgi:hypothetical protein
MCVPLSASIAGSFLFVLEWVGYRRKFEVLGEPRAISEIWWHLPAFIVFCALVMILWPWRFDR